MQAGLKTIDQANDRAPSLVDSAYAALKQAIRESVFAPGYQASAGELALRLGVSRTPVHEAALRLQEEGLVRIVPKRGILICALAPDDIREIYEVLIAIEASAAELAAGLPDAERRLMAQDLARETDAMARALDAGDLADWGRADEAFHRILVERCGNSRFVRIIQTVNDQSHRARTLTLRLRPRLPISTEEHRAMIDAIRDGVPELAREAARQHRVRARGELLPLIESIGLRHL
ncbi:GntR family transcriptional regulator [Bosea psychrotolerans]|uniref:DNA-binding GntR family transcriptional regulator n=1 Tax=Bosea psychrotolerans TaxID=1871628 RepID=A0A2S4MQG2_9HYPH|nr:GntR family transcriptional regulator [Bosea psychrotolerans]POR57010.1 DNA-binding GntR family transcriptional regulator [Bosea psychrotolerans]